MKIFSAPLALTALGICVILHIVSAVLPKRASRILNYINIGMHIVLVAALAASGLSIEESVLAYLFSLFVYTVSAALRYKADAARAARLAALEESFIASREGDASDKEEGNV